MVMQQGLRLAAIGIVLGTLTALGLAQLLTRLLFGVKPWDPLVFTTVPLVLGCVAFLAVWIPSMRAARLDPAPAIGYE